MVTTTVAGIVVTARLGRRGSQAAGVDAGRVALRQPRPQADDLGFARGQGQQALAAAAQEDRRMRALRRLGRAVVAGDGVVLA